MDDGRAVGSVTGRDSRTEPRPPAGQQGDTGGWPPDCVNAGVLLRGRAEGGGPAASLGRSAAVVLLVA